MTGEVMPRARIAAAARTGDSAWVRTCAVWQSGEGDVVTAFAGVGGKGASDDLADLVAKTIGEPPAGSPRERAEWTVRRAHAIALARNASSDDPSFVAHGAIATVAWGNGAAIAHAGNTRVYRIRAGTVECLTRDDVAGDEPPMNNFLVNAAGMRDTFQVHVRDIALQPQDVIVCCTASVWGTVGDAGLAALASPDAAIARVAEQRPSSGAAIAIVRWDASADVPRAPGVTPVATSSLPARDERPPLVDAAALAAAPARWHQRRIDVTAQWHFAFEQSSFVGAWLEIPKHTPYGYGTYRARVVGTWLYPTSDRSELRAETIDVLEILDQPPPRPDALTGLPRRAALITAFEQAVYTGQPFAVAVLDLDHFKRLNDTHGYAAGDEVLRRWASTTAMSLRLSDVVVRFGGEELAVILPGTDLESAHGLLDRVLADVRALAIGDARITVTCSAGVTEVRPGEAMSTLFERADRALYEAKRAGRDRVVSIV